MRNFLKAGALAALAVSAVGAASAEVEFSGNVAVTTDYHWRNVSQSDKDMAIQGGFDLAMDTGFYAGTWLSNVDFGDDTDTNIEWDVYAGYGGNITETLTFDVGVIQYIYPDSSDSDLDFTEIYGGLGTEFGIASVSATLYYDPDHESLWAEAGLGLGLTDSFSVDLGVGTYADGGEEAGEPWLEEYVGYNFGGTYSVGGFDLDLRYYDTDLDGDDTDNVVFTIGRAL